MKRNSNNRCARVHRGPSVVVVVVVVVDRFSRDVDATAIRITHRGIDTSTVYARRGVVRRRGCESRTVSK